PHRNSEGEFMPQQSVRARAGSAKRRATNRRISVRFRPAQEITCYWSTGGEYSSARVYDISSGGACLLVRAPVEPGTELLVELINGPHTFLCVRRLRVSRIYHRKGNDAVVGGAFDRALNYDELLPFIA